MQIVPALYLKDGKLAAYKPGNMEEVEFLNIDPYDMIARLDDLELTDIAIVDIDAARGEKNNHALLGSLSNVAIATLHVGGGLKEMEYLKSLQYAGVDYFILGTAVFDHPEFLRELADATDVKSERIAISLDMLDGHLTHHGWTQEAELSVTQLVEACIEMGFSRFILNDISSDQNQGPDFDFLTSMLSSYPECHWIASGQINTFEDIEKLKAIGLESVVVGNEVYRNPELLKRIAAFNKAEED